MPILSGPTKKITKLVNQTSSAVYNATIAFAVRRNFSYENVYRPAT